MKTSTKTHERRLALVAGEAKGIGQAIAAALAARGAHVIATDLAPPHQTAERLGPAAHAFRLDVTQEHWHSVLAKSRDVGDVGIVVNNAGYFPNRVIDERLRGFLSANVSTNGASQAVNPKRAPTTRADPR